MFFNPERKVYIVQMYLCRPNDDDVFELMVLEVGGAQRHHEVAEADERPVGLREQTDHQMVVQHHPCYFVPYNICNYLGNPQKK